MIIFHKDYKELFDRTEALKIIDSLSNKIPIKESKSVKIYFHNNFFIKQFSYKSRLSLFLRLKGLQCFLVSKYLLKKNIDIPLPIFYAQLKNFEFFVSEKIEGINIFEYLKVKKSKKEFENFLLNFNKFLDKILSKRIYHTDFDPTNVLIDKKNNFYLIDIESIIPFVVFTNPKKKMLKKFNRLLIKNFGFDVNY